MNGRELLGVPACPDWCDRASDGHPYAVGLDDSEPPTFHRLHHRQLDTLANDQARLHLSQLESTTGPGQPCELAAPEVVLSMAAQINGQVRLPSAAALTAFVDRVRSAAEQLTTDEGWQ